MMSFYRTVMSFCIMITLGPMSKKTVHETLKVLNWEILPHQPYSPDIATSDYHLFRSMHSALLGEHFISCEEVTKWVDQWITFKKPDFFIAESICCLKNGKTLYFSMKSILNEIYFILLFQFLLYFLLKKGENLVVHPI